jgi:hypothetical protein
MKIQFLIKGFNGKYNDLFYCDVVPVILSPKGKTGTSLERKIAGPKNEKGNNDPRVFGPKQRNERNAVPYMCNHEYD